MQVAIHKHMEGFVITNPCCSDAVQQWNDEHPELSIQAGHVIMELNGFSDYSNMREQLRSASTLNLLMSTVRDADQEKAFQVHLKREGLFAALDALVVKVHSVPGDCGAEACSICHEDMDGAENHGGGCCVRLPCGHHFHELCVKKWLVTGKHRCPLCNGHLDLQ